jgi:hypothetical protein
MVIIESWLFNRFLGANRVTSKNHLGSILDFTVYAHALVGSTAKGLRAGEGCTLLGPKLGPGEFMDPGRGCRRDVPGASRPPVTYSNLVVQVQSS